MNEMNKLKRVHKITMINYKIDEKIHSNLYYPVLKSSGQLKLSLVPDNVLTMVSKLAGQPLTKNPYEAMERDCNIINDDTDMSKHKHSMTKIMESLMCGHYEYDNEDKKTGRFTQLQTVRWDESVTIRDSINEIVNMSQLLYHWVNTRRDCWVFNIEADCTFYRFDKLLSKLELYNDFVGLADIVADRYIKQYKIDKTYKLGTYENAVVKKPTTSNESNIFEAGCKDEIQSTEIPENVKKDIMGMNNASFVGKITNQIKKLTDVRSILK